MVLGLWLFIVSYDILLGGLQEILGGFIRELWEGSQRRRVHQNKGWSVYETLAITTDIFNLDW